MASAAVDLPQPDSPTSPYASPRSIENDTPRSTCRSMPAHAVDELELATSSAAAVSTAGAHRS